MWTRAVDLDALEQVRARGLTTFELSNDIAAELRLKYIEDPKVSVEVDTSRPLSWVRSSGRAAISMSTP